MFDPTASSSRATDDGNGIEDTQEDSRPSIEIAQDLSGIAEYLLIATPEVSAGAGAPVSDYGGFQEQDAEANSHSDIAWAHHNVGKIAYRRGDFAAAKTSLELSLQMFEELHDTHGVAWCYNNLGKIAYRQHDYGQAQIYLERSLKIFRESGDRSGIAWALNNLGKIAYRQQDLDRAAELLEESLRLCRDMEDKQGMVWSLENLGKALCRRGRLNEARPLYEESLVISEQIGDRQGVASSLENLGRLLYRQGDCAEAVTYLQQSLELYRESVDMSGVAWVLNTLGRIAYRRQDYLAAQSHLQESVMLFRDAGDREALKSSLENLGKAFFRSGDYDSARLMYEEALQLSRDTADIHGVQACLESLAHIAYKQDKPGLATTFAAEARSVASTAAANAAHKRGHSDQDWARGITNNSGYWGRQEPDGLFGSASKDSAAGARPVEGADLDTGYVPYPAPSGEVRGPSPENAFAARQAPEHANVFATQRIVTGQPDVPAGDDAAEGGAANEDGAEETFSPRIGLTGESI